MTEHSRRSLELVRGRPPSGAQARALGQSARFAMLDARWSDAIETGRQAEQMAEALGLDAVRADALATIGTARHDLGDRSGDADLELAIELAETAKAPLALSRALNNLGWRYAFTDLRRSYELTMRNYETMRRYGHVSQVWWARGQLADTAYELGHWDEALEHIEAVLDSIEGGRPHYFEGGCRQARAAIALGRGDERLFEEDLVRSMELAAQATDPQASATNAAIVAVYRARGGDEAGARAALRSAVEMVARAETPDMISYEGALVAAVLDVDLGELGVVRVQDDDLPRRRAAVALYDRDFVRAADALEELGFASDEFYLRLLGGKQLIADGRVDEGAAQVERALAFYRGVRATRFVAEAEALLASVEQQTA